MIYAKCSHTKSIWSGMVQYASQDIHSVDGGTGEFLKYWCLSAGSTLMLVAEKAEYDIYSTSTCSRIIAVLMQARDHREVVSTLQQRIVATAMAELFACQVYTPLCTSRGYCSWSFMIFLLTDMVLLQGACSELCFNRSHRQQSQLCH